MEQIHKDAIRRNYVFIKGNLCLGEVIDRLYEENILTDAMKENIKAETCQRDEIDKFVDILFRRGPNAFSVFMRALHDSNQSFIADKLAEFVRNERN